MSTFSEPEYRRVIKNTIMSRLYQKQLRYWNKELRKLSEDNASSQGRGTDGILYAVFFRNKRWAPEKLDWTDNSGTEYCLPLNPKMPGYTERMEEIANEFEELCEEKYEAERFLSNLVLFHAPPDRLKRILGRTLYRVAREEIEHWCASFSDHEWELNNEFSLRTFVESNQDIIERMNQRVMINLVTV